MKINFTCVGKSDPQKVYDWLVSYEIQSTTNVCRGSVEDYNAPKNHYAVDLIGEDLVYVNEMFPMEQYTWKHWFESVFMVPEDMYSFLLLKFK